MSKRPDGGSVVDHKPDSGSSPCKYNFSIDLNNKNLAHTIMIDLVGKGKRVLDVGCATGYLDRVLVEMGCVVTGLEANGEAAALARQYCEEVVNADVEQFDWKRTLGETRFDVILFGDVLEHLKDPGSVLRAARDFLSPEGYVVASIPNVAHASVRIQLLQGVFQYRSLGLLDETHLRFFTFHSIKEMFDRAGYVIVDMRRVKLGPFDTEFNLQCDGVPQGVLEYVLEDPEATTYQFVCRAHATNQPIALSFELKDVQKELSSAQGRIDTLTAGLKETKDLLAETKQQLAKKEEALAEKEETLAEKEETLAEARQRQERTDIEKKCILAERMRIEVEQIRHEVEVSRIYPSVDIVVVGYNSARFLTRLFESLSQSEYPRQKLTVTIVDNASVDDTEGVVNSSKPTLGFPVRYLRLPRNRGFAGGANVGARAGKAEYICVVNPDTEFYPDTLKELVAAVCKDPLIGIADARQVPHEHPKYFELATGETSWCSGACLLVRRSVIKEIGLFDAQFFMYCEDVDLSWRIWSAGYKCVYAPRARIVHHKEPRDYKPAVDYYYGVRNGFLMRLIYGGRPEIIRYYLDIRREIFGAQTDPLLRRQLWRAGLYHLPLIPHALWRRWKMPRKLSKWIRFCGWDYGEKR